MGLPGKYNMRAGFLKTSFVILFVSVLCSCEPEKPITVTPDNNNTNNTPAKTVPTINYSIVNTLPHDSTCFTEGYFFHNGQLFESSGAPDYMPNTRSMFGIVDRKTGKVEKKGEIDKTIYFGEGIVILNNLLYQLTYTNQVGFIYDAKTFTQKGQFGYLSKQGWGLTTNGKELIMSDGTNALTFINPANFQITKTVLVSENNYAVDLLNELEYVNGFIYANVYLTNNIVKIDAETGDVVGKMNLDQITAEAKRRNPNSLELNGIAYDSLTKNILVTGKMWPTAYELKLSK